MQASASRLIAIYHVRSSAQDIDRRATAIAVEQSIELPVEAVDDARIRANIVGQVMAVEDLGAGRFAVTVAIASETVPPEPGQLLNMLFGNTSL